VATTALSPQPEGETDAALAAHQQEAATTPQGRTRLLDPAASQQHKATQSNTKQHKADSLAAMAPVISHISLFHVNNKARSIIHMAVQANDLWLPAIILISVQHLLMAEKFHTPTRHHGPACMTSAKHNTSHNATIS
jgi:hypothetical protein